MDLGRPGTCFTRFDVLRVRWGRSSKLPREYDASAIHYLSLQALWAGASICNRRTTGGVQLRRQVANLPHKTRQPNGPDLR